MPKTHANGISIYYELYGPADSDVLVLSNGILMSTASWAYQIPVLSQHCRLLLYDCRGMWQSEHPPGPYTMQQHADDLAALLDALHIQRAHIGGISYGAEISMAFALAHPDRTLSLILASAVSHVDPQLKGLVESWAYAARAQDPELLYQVSYPINFSDGWILAQGDLLAQARERYAQLDYQALLHLLDCFINLNLTPRLEEIPVPTLVMVGEEDALKPRKYAEIISRGIPNSNLVLIPSAGHALMWERPRLFSALILGFMALHQSQ